jgi:cytochrome c2
MSEGNSMKRRAKILAVSIAASLSLLASGGLIHAQQDALPDSSAQPQSDAALLKYGQWVFRYDTFGDEITWTDKLHMNDVIQGDPAQGLPGVSPATALAVGLKVDVEALPPAVKKGIADGTLDLNSPATTLALLKLDAVVGLRGVVRDVQGKPTLARLGVTCALCHSTVDDAFAPGIGHRLDGWPNRQLNPGAILALSPAFTAAQKEQLNSWGPGKYDARWNVDGLSDPTVIPPAYGLKGVHRHVFTGDGPNLSYWNRYVAVTQMGGQGVFSDPRLGTHLDPGTPGLRPGWKPGILVANGDKDRVSAALPALQAYQLSIAAPPPPAGSFDPAAARAGKAVFQQAGCASCHSGPALTDANVRLHPPRATPALDKLYVYRSSTGMWRTTPLHGIWQHPPYFHDGSAKTLADVVTMYDEMQNLQLTPEQKQDLVQYLKSL